MPSREEIIKSLEGCMDVHRSGLWSSGCAFCSYAKRSNPKCFMDLTRDAVALLREQPEQKHGHWKLVQDYYDDEHWQCSACGCEWYLEAGNPEENNMHYCPECGALMDEDVKKNGNTL